MDKTRKGLIGALLVGLVFGPAVALAAGGAFGGGDAAVPVSAPVAAAPETAAASLETSGTEGTAPDPDDDLQTACTVDGPALAEGEAAGTLADVETAALDALREICSDAGLALPDPPASGEVVEEIVVSTVTVSASSSAASAGYEEYEHGDDDEYEHGDDDEYEHGDDDEYEDDDDEYEDDDDEHGDDEDDDDHGDEHGDDD